MSLAQTENTHGRRYFEHERAIVASSMKVSRLIHFNNIATPDFYALPFSSEPRGRLYCQILKGSPTVMLMCVIFSSSTSLFFLLLLFPLLLLRHSFPQAACETISKERKKSHVCSIFRSSHVASSKLANSPKGAERMERDVSNDAFFGAFPFFTL